MKSRNKGLILFIFFTPAAYGAGFNIAPGFLISSSAWPDFDYGLACEGDLRVGPFSSETRFQYRLVSGNKNDLSASQVFIYPLLAGDNINLGAGGGAGLSFTENDSVYIPEDPNARRRWLIDARPVVELTAVFKFGRFSAKPAFRFQISAYHNFDPRDEPYKYVEPYFAAFYNFSTRWSLKAGGRYWRSIPVGQADEGFFEVGPAISW